ncbi:phage tail protein [Klebsiella pneumoniae]|nr:phage tail protein [Klebsiella pneumoniae]MDE8934968.1 phage tail protein [Klebsiella pneumoniae]
MNDNDSADISISLMLTERTIVREDGGKLHIETVPKPQPLSRSYE